MKTRLLICDFDGTLTRSDVLDALCGVVGGYDESRRINEQYIAGLLDGHTALKRRFGLLRGTRLETLHEALSRTPLTDGAAELFAHANSMGIESVVISGNADLVLAYFQPILGYTHYFSSHIPVIDGVVGEIDDPRTSFIDKKARAEQFIALRGLSPEEIIAVGDSPSDEPMLRLAGRAFFVNKKGEPDMELPEVASLKEIIRYME